MLASSSSSLAAGMAGDRVWTDAEWAAWYAQWEEEEEQEKKNNAWYQPVAKEELAEDRSAGVVHNAGVVEPPHKKIKLPLGPLHKAKDAGPCGAVPKACAGAPCGFGANNPGGAASGSSGNAGQPAAFLAAWILYRQDFVRIRFFCFVLFLLLFDFLHHAGPAGSMAGWKAKAADAGAVGEKVPVGQQVSDAIPAEYHRPICWPLQLLLALQFQALVLVRLALLAPLAAAGTSMGAGTTTSTAVPAGFLCWLPLAGSCW